MNLYADEQRHDEKKVLNQSNQESEEEAIDEMEGFEVGNFVILI